jgi:AraC-like DNA-binding protein
LPYERYVLEIPLDRLSSPWKEAFVKPKIFNIAENRPLLEVFHRLDTYEELLGIDDFQNAAEHLMHECMILLKVAYSTSRIEHSYDPLTKRILKYINENLSKPLFVEDLAEHFFLSKSHIQNVFYQNMKIGVKSYIVQKKMLLAKELLQNGKKPYEVAVELGYNDYTTFYKNFRKYYHAPPQNFVKSKVNGKL